MSGDRYSTITREVPVDRPRNTAYPDAPAATGDLNSQHRVTLHPAGFRIRERGALDATVVHAYRCPVHGLVDVRVPRGEVPDALNCAERIEPRQFAMFGMDAEQREELRARTVCGRTATWAGSQCGQGWAAGECRS